MRAGGEPTDVVVCGTLDAAPRGHRRRARTRSAAPEPAATPVPLTRLTVVATRELGGAERARSWLERLDRDPDEAEEFVGRALRLVNRALRAQAASSRDPYVRELPAAGALVTRIGYGEGEQVADGRWIEARELERAVPRRRRRAPEESQERVAAVLGGHDELVASETLALRARLDLDHGDPRAAVLQLRAAIEALVGETSGAGGDEIDELRRRARELERVGAEPQGELDPDRAERLRETLAMCERSVRRRHKPSRST